MEKDVAGDRSRDPHPGLRGPEALRERGREGNAPRARGPDRRDSVLHSQHIYLFICIFRFESFLFWLIIIICVSSLNQKGTTRWCF